MSTLINSFTPDQIDFAISAYGSILNWIEQCNIVVVDIML